MMSRLTRRDVARSENYLAFPDVAMTPRGRLVCAYFEGDAHTPSWSQIVVRTSADLGLTWTEGMVVERSELARDGYCWNCPRLSSLPNGKLMLMCDYEDRAEQKMLWAWTSGDDGRSWSAKARVMSRGLVPDRVVVAPSGRLLLVVPCQEEGTVLFSSDDQGNSWNRVAEIRPRHAPKSAETSLVVIDDRRFIAYTRTEGALGAKSISTDGGNTWEDRCASCFTGHRPCGGRLRSGKIMVTHRRPGAGTFAYLEAPESALNPEWKAQRGSLLMLEGCGAQQVWDYGYSGWVQLPDSRLFAVYYTKEPVNYLPTSSLMPFIRGVWFSEQDFDAPPGDT